MNTSLKNRNKVACDICHKPFDYRGLGVHRANKHPEAPSLREIPKHKCKDCPETFRTTYALVKHRREIHPKQRRTREAAEKRNGNGGATSSGGDIELPTLMACPMCACDLKAVALAIGMPSVISCPVCACNLKAVAVAVAML